MARERAGEATEDEAIIDIKTASLVLDGRNPRLAGYLDKAKPSQQELLAVLWRHMAIDELAMSIAASGYLRYEPLIVVEEGGKHVVVEGNRRLAAVRLLLDDDARQRLKATDLPKIGASLRRSLATLPCMVAADRQDTWRYLGFKHVNGPARWDSYPKAMYIADVRDQYGVGLDDIAAQIGDKHKTVQRLYRALRVIKQAESEAIFDRKNRYKRHFSFSHLYTGLGYDGISEFVGLKDADSDEKFPIPKSRLPQLRELCHWLYGDRSLDQRPVVESQNPDLRQLDEVLKSEKATTSLRAGLPLSLALEISQGDETVFRKALIEARESLQKARATLSTGFQGEEEMLDLASDIQVLSQDLMEEMTRKTRNPKRRDRRKEA